MPEADGSSNDTVDGHGCARQLNRLKGGNIHLAGLAEFFGPAPPRPKDFHAVGNAAFGTGAFHGDAVSALKLRQILKLIDLLVHPHFFGPHP
jgi:hypothetical protein